MSTSPSTDRSCAELRVLLVDDEDAFRTNLAEILREDGHDVLAYRSPTEVPALDDLAPIAAVITDFDMPAVNGLAFADAIHGARPDLPVMIVTANPSVTIAPVTALRSDFLSVLSKTVAYDRIHELLHTVTERGLSAGLRRR